MGTPHFAAYQLEQLVRHGFDVVGVVTMPDKPMGRGMKLGQSAVKEYAVQQNIPVLQPEKLRDETFLTALSAWSADVFVVVAFRMLPKLVWSMPAKGTLNLHASLLPQYRGAAPINWAIINGEKETGVTTFFIQEEIDTGDIILREKVDIEATENAGTLHDKLMTVGANTIIKDNKVKPVPQDELKESALKAAPKIFKEHCQIDWSKSSTTIIDLVRGMSPYPTAWSKVKLSGDRSLLLKVYEIVVGDRILTPGEVYSDGKTELQIGTGDTAVKLIDLQLEGKKRMDIRSFLMGFDLKSLVAIS